MSGKTSAGYRKTTNTVHIARALAELKRKVLIIDLDMNHGATRHFGIEPEAFLGAFELLVGAEAPRNLVLTHADKEEGIDFFFLHAPVEIYTDAEGNVRGMKVEEMQLGDPDEKGRRKPVPTGRFKDLACDTVIYALGTKANPIVTQSTPGLGLTATHSGLLSDADDRADDCGPRR